jgi:hypothetical protein
MPARQETVPKEGAPGWGSLLENPSTFYDLVDWLFIFPEERRREAKEKFFDWLEKQWKEIDQKISSAPPVEHPSWASKFDRYLLKSIDIPDGITLSEHVQDFYLRVQIDYKEEEARRQIKFVINKDNRKPITVYWKRETGTTFNGMTTNVNIDYGAKRISRTKEQREEI